MSECKREIVDRFVEEVIKVEVGKGGRKRVYRVVEDGSKNQVGE